MYTAIYTVHTPPCTRAVNTAVYTAVNTAVYTVTDGPCTWPVHGRVYTVYTRPWAAVYRLCTAALGHVQTVYTAVQGPCTWSVRVSNTAVYAVGTWQNTAGYAARTRPCTYRIHGRARTAHGRLLSRFTARVHGRVRTMYTAVHGPSVTGTRPCTRSCTLYTAVFTDRVHHDTVHSRHHKS